jgi:twinkle protein
MAYAKLYEQGWGEDINTEDEEEEEWSDKLGSVSFLSDDIEENTYLEQARKGEIAQGLSTGWRDIDEYFRLKPNSINIGLGYDGVGKSVFMLSLATASSVLHDWKWGMVMPENRTAMSRRRLIETKSGRPIESFKREPLMFDKQIQESRESFKIISNKKHYSISDVIDMGKRLYEYYGINALLIDPWNFFKVSGDGYGHNNEMLSQLRVFAESYCSVYVMAHPSSFTPRNSKDADGYLQAPSKYSIQGGADFPYRVDDFFITHRIVNHSDREVKRTMQFIAEKVKERETGGQVHDMGDYSSLIYETRHGFTGYWDSNGDNPMYKALKSKTEIREKLIGISPEEAF